MSKEVFEVNSSLKADSIVFKLKLYFLVMLIKWT